MFIAAQVNLMPRRLSLPCPDREAQHVAQGDEIAGPLDIAMQVQPAGSVYVEREGMRRDEA